MRHRITLSRWMFWLGGLLLALGGCASPSPLTPVYLPTPDSSAAPLSMFDVPNARIAFTGGDDLYVMHLNGSGREAALATAAYEGMLAWSPNGQYVAFVSAISGNAEVYLAPADAPADTARWLNLSNNPEEDYDPAWSPNGLTLAFSSHRDQSWGIFLVDLSYVTVETLSARSSPRRLTYNSFYEGHPAFSPDGQRLAYTSDRGFNWQIYVIHLTGNDPQPLLSHAALNSVAYPAWSPDGRRLAYALNSGDGWDLYVITLDDPELAPIALTDAPGSEWDATWSPDGEWLLYTARHQGTAATDLYLIRADGTDETRLTNSPISEMNPVWIP